MTTTKLETNSPEAPLTTTIPTTTIPPDYQLPKFGGCTDAIDLAMGFRFVSVVDYTITATLLAGLAIGRALDGYSCTESCTQKKMASVCGSNGITYRNPCTLNADNCQHQKLEDKVVKLFEGPCSTDPTPEKCTITECPAKKMEVCGSNRLTYSSYCDLVLSNCRTRSYVHAVSRGPCQSTKGIIRTY